MENLPLIMIEQSKKHMLLPPQRIVWCYSEWQPLYTSTLGGVEFHQGLPEQLDAKVRNLVFTRSV